MPVKTVFRQAATDIPFVAALRTCPSLMGMTGNAIRIKADKDDVVLIGGFIDHPLAHKCIQHILVNFPVSDQIRIDP